MPKKPGINKVLVIGAGPIVIGQAAEFDYAGTQACKALREEDIEVVLVNSNPATIMTDMNMADKVYIEPLTLEFVTRIIKQEKPDGLLPMLGGQIGLDIAMQLAEAGVLAAEGVKLLGTPLAAIKKAEDRELFKETMLAIGEPVPESMLAATLAEAQAFVQKIGFPVIIRPVNTRDRSGGGIAHDVEELVTLVNHGLNAAGTHQVLIERSVAGWKEIEYEVMRDSADNCIAICNMENIDPIGIHTGDSIVVTPTQTLSAIECHMLHASAIKVLRALGVEGGCNIQFALDPNSLKYYLIEVTPWISRSSALASKATGYPIAKVAAKIALGLYLDEIVNSITGRTYACAEPVIDYVVLKVPRWSFDKFALADRTIGTQMKATGEVMSIARNFESAMLKAIRSLEIGLFGFANAGFAGYSLEKVMEKVKKADDERLFMLAEALRRGISLRELVETTGIDLFFLDKIKKVVDMEEKVRTVGLHGLTEELLLAAKKLGMADAQLADLVQADEATIRAKRKAMGIEPVFKKVDTCAGEFEAITPYYYSSYEQEDEVVVSDRRKALVIGAGPIRIGQGIEFDYCSVHASWTLMGEGMESIIANNNPETVSTDFDASDKLYFEPLVTEDVLNIIDRENPAGVIVQFGGQTAVNLAEPLNAAGVNIIGTPLTEIARTADRQQFNRLLQELAIPRPAGCTVFSSHEAMAAAAEIGYPVLVSRGGMTGGPAATIVDDEAELSAHLKNAGNLSVQHPLFIDKYLMGKKVEVDAISDGRTVLIPGIMEHIERAGVHSGDSITVYPSQTLTAQLKEQITDYTTRLATGLQVKGLVNIQYVVYHDQVFVTEVNPCASRTVPYMSKITGVPIVKTATRAALGHTLAELGYAGGLWPDANCIAVKAPVFSFAKLTDVDTYLGPEMKSTGEVMGVDKSFAKAFYKAMAAAGYRFPHHGTILATIADKDKEEALPIIRQVAALGFKVVATEGTAHVLQEAGLAVETVNKLDDGSQDIVDLIKTGEINLIINTISKGKEAERDGFIIRRAAVEYNVPCLTSLDTARVVFDILATLADKELLECISLDKINE